MVTTYILCIMWLGMFAASEDIDRADQDKVDTATTSLPTSTGIGTTAATSQGIVMVLLLPPLNGKSFARVLKPLNIS